MVHIKTSLFLTTYNWPDALALCLKSILAQTVLPNEIIIADDGSTNETKDLINEFRSISKIPIEHIWIEDKGYRINVIRNLAIETAKYPFIIQIDGDVILDKNFVKDHLHFARLNRFNIGRRIQVDKDTTAQFCNDRTYSGLNYLRSYFICIINHYLFYSSRTVRGLRGCNVAYWKTDAYRVNGYNEDMIGKGPEDKEFGIRVLNSGVKGFNLRNYAICYHLHHSDEGRVVDYQQLTRMYQTALKKKITRISNGIEKYNFANVSSSKMA